MSARTLAFADNRVLIVCSPSDRFDELLHHRPFAVLFPAYDEVERKVAEGMIPNLIQSGCLEFCCIGPQSERLHDSIDWIVEDGGTLNVVTTGHTDDVEGCEYFILAAAGQPKELLAVIASHLDLVKVLEKVARTAC